MPNIITYQQFESQAILTETFFLNGLKTVTPDISNITVNEKGNISLTYDESKNDTLFACSLVYTQDGQEILENNSCLWSKEKGVIKINYNTNNKGEYYLLLLFLAFFNGPKIDYGAIFIINSNKSVNPPQYFPETHYNFYDIELIEPLNETLTKGTFVDFKIRTNIREKVFLLIGDTFQREFEKQNDGIYIAESVYIFDDIIEIAKEVEKGYLPIFTYKTANNTKMEEEPTFPETSIELPPNVLYSPVIDTITKGKKYTFKIKCKSARKMQIFDGNNFFDLTEKEKIFLENF